VKIHTFKRTSGIVIQKSFYDENPQLYESVKNSLTRIVKDERYSISRVLKFYTEGNKSLKIPRFFPIQNYISNCIVEDLTLQGEDIKINHDIQLRDELQKNIVKFYLNNNCGVIQAPPGSGKTVVSILAVSKIKKKTLILVHRSSLKDQWKGPGTIDRKQGFLAYTDLNESDIGILDSGSYEKSLNKPIIISTDQAFISLLKKQREKFLRNLNEAGIGMLISDECHTTVGAPTFSECSIHIPAKRVYGLSATPYRYDGNGDIINYHLGEVFIPEGEASVMSAKVIVLLFNYGICSSKSRAYVYWGGYFQKARYLNLLKKSEMFLNVCKSILNKNISEDRNLIFVAERIKLIELLYKWLPVSDKSMFTGNANISYADNKFVFSTPQKIRDGVDIPTKDSLILTSPISNIEQMCGRIVRTSNDKKEPIIIDMVDIDDQNISSTFLNRLNYYKKKEWDIQFILINNDGNKIKLNEEKTLEIILNKRGE